MTDARAFPYPLEPLRRRREWELETARLVLGRATGAVELARRRLRALEVRFAAARSHAALHAEQAAGFSLHGQRVAATYFTALLRAIESAAEDVRRLEVERERAMREVLAASIAFETVDRHRAAARAEHEGEVRRREFAVADESWTQRSGTGGLHEQR
jgi:flagellar export protein FliJ